MERGHSPIVNKCGCLWPGDVGGQIEWRLNDGRKSNAWTNINLLISPDGQSDTLFILLPWQNDIGFCDIFKCFALITMVSKGESGLPGMIIKRFLHVQGLSASEPSLHLKRNADWIDAKKIVIRQINPVIVMR